MTIPSITEENISSWFDGGSFSRGKNYYRNGYIMQPKTQGETLKSRCVGSASSPYRVQVMVAQKGNKVSTSCSCPLGGGCKHCVALLLQWAYSPETFNQVEDVSSALTDRSKEELIKLIEKMVDRHPDLETLIEISTLSSTEASVPLDPSVIRRQIMNVLQDSEDDEYDYHGELDLNGLDAFDDMIKNYFAAEEWFNAATVSMTIIDVLLGSYEQFYDENGDVSVAVDDEVDNLETALEKLTDPKERTTILKALFDVYAWDVDFGGIDMGYRAGEIMVEAANAKEKQQLAAWTKEKLANVPGEKYSSEWNRSAYGGLLLELEADSLDDEAFLRVCRESGRTADLIERLLSLKRVDEAVEAARQVENYSLIQLANQFVQHGHEAAIIPIMQERSKEEGRRHSYSDWLKDRAIAGGDTANALSILRGIFDASPDLHRFKELAELARQRDEWEALRGQIMAQLENDKKYLLLTEIHIDEKNIDKALHTVEQIESADRPFGFAYNTRSLRLSIADAATETHPYASIRFYLEAAERLIAGRGRGNYKEAAKFLKKVRTLYQNLDKNAEWLTLLDTVREQNRTLRAMHDEFDKAGLAS